LKTSAKEEKKGETKINKAKKKKKLL